MTGTGFWFKVKDELGNETGQKNLPTTTIDSRKPKITSWTSTDVNTGDTVGKNEITFAFELNENVKGFTKEDIKITPEGSGYFSSFSGSNANYTGTLNVNGPDQNITLEIIGGTFQSKIVIFLMVVQHYKMLEHFHSEVLQKPLVVLNGDESITINKNDTYTEQKARVTVYNFDGTSTTPEDIGPTTGTVDNTKVDTYILTYSYTNDLGVKSDDVTRTVHVEEPPDITPPDPPNITKIIIEGGFVTIVGNAEANSKLKIKENTDELSMLDLDNTGTFSQRIGPLSQGNHVLDFTATDAASNTSNLTRKTITVDYEFSIGSSIPDIELLYDGHTGKLSCIYANTSKHYYMDLRLEGEENNAYINEINSSLAGYNIIDSNNYINNSNHIYI